MEKNFKGGLKAVLWYLAIQIVFCIVNSKPGTSIIAKPLDAVLICTLAGPFMWIPYLIYPCVLPKLSGSVFLRSNSGKIREKMVEQG